VVPWLTGNTNIRMMSKLGIAIRTDITYYWHLSRTYFSLSILAKNSGGTYTYNLYLYLSQFFLYRKKFYYLVIGSAGMYQVPT